MNPISEAVKSRRFSNLYLLFGEEDYLRRLYAKQLRRAIVPENDDMNVSVWNEDTFDLGEFESQAVTMPFFAEYRLILVDNSGLFKKGGADLAAFLPGLPSTTIVIFTEKEADKRSKLFKVVRDAGVVYECKHLKPDELSDWILRRFDRAGRKVQRSAMQLFMERTGSDMNLISQEIEKLVCYTQGKDAVMLEDVQALTTERTETKVSELVRAIGLRDRKRALLLYDELLSMRESPLMIIVVMGRQFFGLSQVKELRERGMDRRSIAERLGMDDYIVRKNLEQASMFTLQELAKGLELCVRADEAIKFGKMNDRIAGETLIMQVTA